MLQGVVERKSLPQLLGNKGVHCAVQGAPCEQVDTCLFELSCAGPAQDKAQSLFFDKTVYFVEQFRQSLHFV